MGLKSECVPPGHDKVSAQFYSPRHAYILQYTFALPFFPKRHHQCHATHRIHLFLPSNLNMYPSTMIRTPHAPHTLIKTLHRLRNSSQLLPIRIPQQLRLLQHLLLRQVPYTYRLFASVDISAFYDGVSARPGRYGDFDLGICGGEFVEGVAEE